MRLIWNTLPTESLHRIAYALSDPHDYPPSGGNSRQFGYVKSFSCRWHRYQKLPVVEFPAIFLAVMEYEWYLLDKGELRLPTLDVKEVRASLLSAL
jgi:hypothetical protein